MEHLISTTWNTI